MIDPADDRGVPKSAGIPPLVRIAGAIGVMMILGMAALTIAASQYDHVWPAKDTMTIPLENKVPN